MVPINIALVVVGLVMLFLQTTVAGRETYAVGGNLEAARFSGIRTGWAVMRVYVIMGICCGIAAVVELGRFGSAATNAGDGYELTVIASAVVGGASLLGGRGTALGALLGTLVITSLENGILTMQWDTNYTRIIVGGSIILAVSVDRLSDYFFRGGRRGAAH
jgi:ribose/xylose/arabinose/galactoside ABC-type transport system permease subunit